MKTKKLKKYWILEWNERQNHFHIMPNDGMIFNYNIEEYIIGMPSGWKILAVFKTHLQAHKFREKLKEYRK